MPDDKHPDRTDEPRIPADLAEDLSRLYRPGAHVPGGGVPEGDVPEHIDGPFRARIHRHFDEQQRDRMRLPRALPWAAAAAAVMIAAIWWALPSRQQMTAPDMMVQALDPADVDFNGKVNILDALALARQVEDGWPPNTTFDLNRDGAVDSLDVDLVAMQAVSLNGGTS